MCAKMKTAELVKVIRQRKGVKLSIMTKADKADHLRFINSFKVPNSKKFIQGQGQFREYDVPLHRGIVLSVIGLGRQCFDAAYQKCSFDSSAKYFSVFE